MNSQEATLNPDGTATFPEDDSTPPILNDTTTGDRESPFDDTQEDVIKEAIKSGIDPAFYVLLGFFLIVGFYYFFVIKKKAQENEDEYFSNLDGEKFNLKLPAEVDEYYQIKDKCIASGWEPGSDQGAGAAANGPSRTIAQALMKRAIADIPIVNHIQKESGGMNKLYSQSMCSVKQWRAYQAAEAMVTAEVEDVRAESDEIEPGWSKVIWQQAMQYHQMLKKKHEMEAKAAEEQAKKRKDVEQKVMAARSVQDDEKAKELAAEKAAQELLRAEEREKQSKTAFKKGTMKKGFLDKPKKK